MVVIEQQQQESWQDPLLITDVVSQFHQQNITKKIPPIFSNSKSRSTLSGVVQSSNTSIMEDEHHRTQLNVINSIFRHERSSEATKTNRTKTISWQTESPETIKIENPNCKDGSSLLGFSLASPDLVICSGSPDTPNTRKKDMFEFRQNVRPSIELSLENGIDGSDDAGVEYHTPDQNEFPGGGSIDFLKPSLPVISVNSGGLSNVVLFDEVEFLEDRLFAGGETIQASTDVGDAEDDFVLYQTARCGNFSYRFDELVAGDYIVDLHFAEIVFLSGPPGLRVFDIFVQEEKVVSSLDIYAQVGSNKPLILSDLRAYVNGKDGLLIRFQGVVGKPIVCGISVRKDSRTDFGNNLFDIGKEKSYMGDSKPQEIMSQTDYEMQYKELTDTKRALERFKKEYEMKSKECQEVWKSLRELQNELMRKSMHVGSLAYAIEGQVKEKSRWFSSLRDLTRTIKNLKLEHKKLSEEAQEYKKCIGDVNQMASIVQSAITQKVDLERDHGELKQKFLEGAKERKDLYNKILELKGNIRVFCRCRPLNKDEVDGGSSMTLDFESAKDGELAVKANGTSKKVFKFDSVFGPQADQVDVFEDTAPFATSVLDGFNVCIFAYGQTGTGKTFTMEGTEDARGVNYRTLEELFRVINDRHGLYQYEMSVSVLEVYNEQIRDLLVPESQPSSNSKRLEVRQVADGIHHVPGLVEAHVNNMNEVWEVLKTGSNARAVGATNANEHSSRSHCIHCVMVKGENLMNGECTRSKLWLVDLAGSERVAKTDVQGDRLKETQNINRSLSALGDVISALATKSPHIPFRNSKLTHLLQDSLGGDSKTLMFVQISPNENDLSETLCSLNFASRVRGIELGPAKKQLDSTELIKHKQMVEKAKQDIKNKDSHIKRMEDTIHGLESKAKARDLNNKSLQEKVKELESQLLIERRLARQHIDNKIAQMQEEQKEEPYMIRAPLTEKNSSFRPSLPPPPPDNNILKYQFTDKENKPDIISENTTFPRRTGRLSVCPPISNLEPLSCRRNSLIPLPTTGRLPVLPLQLQNHENDVCELEKTPPLKGAKSGVKKFNSIMRRSLQKKVQLKSPLQPHRRGGVMETGGGGKGRNGQRLRVAKELQNQKDKEKRGWNF
ncbi:hypothetical protein ACHQM5_017945 [Ranunculus cassubicifolius]